MWGRVAERHLRMPDRLFYDVVDTRNSLIPFTSKPRSRGSSTSPRGDCALWNVQLSQILLWLFLAICISLHPEYLLRRVENGVSNYGVHLKTVIPYTLALGCAAVYSLRAAWYMRPRDERGRRLRLLLVSFTVAMSAALFTTYGYKLNGTLDDLHLGTYALVEIFQTWATVWLYLSSKRGYAMKVGLSIQFIGLVLDGLNAGNFWHLLFIGEILSEIGFGVVLVLACRSELTDQIRNPVLP